MGWGGGGGGGAGCDARGGGGGGEATLSLQPPPPPTPPPPLASLAGEGNPQASTVPYPMVAHRYVAGAGRATSSGCSEEMSLLCVSGPMMTAAAVISASTMM